MTDDLRTDVFARGYQTFMGLQLRVTPNVLIPRRETELLGVTACREVAGIAQPRIIDMCSGSGNLACALGFNLPGAMIWACDASAECVRLTRANAEAIGVRSRVTTIEGDLFEGLRTLGLEHSVDLVVCNPPYISSRRLDSQSSWLLEREPRKAFDGGPYGLNIMTRLVRIAPEFLRENGVLAFEFGEGQHAMAMRLVEATQQYHSARLVSNHDGVPRVAVAYRRAIER
jgi:release factor glutamine methyltransferase